MKQGFIAPQFGLAAKRFDEDAADSSQTQPHPATAAAYAAAEAFRPTTGPTVVIKAVKRRRLEVVPTQDAGSPPQTSPGHSGPSEAPAGGVKTPKVFRLTPSRPTPAQDEPQADLFTNEGASENVGADSSASAVSAPSSVAPIRRRRRNPVTAPVLVRHVVFEKPAVETPQIQQPDVEAPADSQASYGTVMNALQQLRDEVGTLRKVQQLLADLDLSTR